MARPTRLEYTDGTSHKFWQVVSGGRTLTVTYGRIGTAGQSKTKTLATPEAAAAEAAKLVASKQKAGYAAPGRSAATATTPPRASKPGEPGPQPLFIGGEPKHELVALWQDGVDLWWGMVYPREAGDEILRAGGTLADALASDGAALERWRFDSAAEAKRAAAWAGKHIKHIKKNTLENDAAAYFAAWSRRIKKQRPCTPRLEPGPGPITLTRDTAHPYIHARPPATSFLSGRTMVPVFSLVGPLDARLGKTAGVYVNVCPQAMLTPYHEHVWEVLIQDPAKPSPIDHYFERSRGEFATLHLSMQVESLDNSVRWAVIEHTGDRHTVGWYRTTHYKNRHAAEQAIAEKIAALQGYKRVARLGPHYPKILAEIAAHHRVPNQKPATVKLRVAHAALSQSVAGFGCAPSMLALKAVRLGGTPHFVQEDWDYAPKNHCSKHPLLCIATVGRGDGPQWSDILNDGDAGAINIHAAPGDPFGTVSFSCC